MHTVSLEEIGISGTNTRAKEHPADLAELVESIKQHGILQPVVVRDDPRKDKRSGDPIVYELVCGHRRLAAAKLAGLEDIPVVVHTLTDEQALEFQITENLQRSDLHPLDEAMGFQQLIDRGHDAAAVATKVGKSRGYVYQRLSFLKLPTASQKLFRAGSMNASLALLVARIPDEKLQAAAAEKILAGHAVGYDDDNRPVHVPLTLAQATELVQDEYMTDLASAQFDILDAQLVPAAGACSTCPKRSGANADLFGDVGARDMCTDVPCFTGKTEAAWLASCAALVAKGAKALTIAESEKASPSHYNGALGNMWVKPGAKTEDGKRTHKQRVAAAGDALPQDWLMRDRKTGKPVVIWKRSEVEKLCAKKTAENSGAKADKADKLPARPKAEHDYERDSFIRREVGTAMGTSVSGAAERMPTTQWLRSMFLCSSAWSISDLAERRGWDLPKRNSVSEKVLQSKLSAMVASLTDEQLRGCVTELLIDFNDDDVRRFGVDPNAVRKHFEPVAAAAYDAKKKAAAERAAAAKAKPAAKKGGKK